MKRGREGGRYRYPDGLIGLQGFIRSCFRLPYRQLEGFTRPFSRWEPRLIVPDYSTTCRRVKRLDIGVELCLDLEEPMTLAVDASGIKVADRDEWMRQRWRKRRGFLKIHIVVDVETKQIVAMEITDDRTGNGKVLKPLVEQAEEHCRVVKVIADGAYDSSSNFSFLEEWEIEPAIRVRKNSAGQGAAPPGSA